MDMYQKALPPRRITSPSTVTSFPVRDAVMRFKILSTSASSFTIMETDPSYQWARGGARTAAGKIRAQERSPALPITVSKVENRPSFFGIRGENLV
jgi:hypothetical protein